MTEEPHGNEARVVSLAQEFSDRHRRGERPTIDEYAARHPELAAEIRELFPMLCMLEDLAPGARGSSVPAAPELGPLKRLGEYRIVREIGRGGMGVVYEAEQETLRRRVAIKVLPFQSFRDSHQLERFRLEAQASARLHHTNIVPVFGVGEDHGVHYYVMQFIRGQTLADVLQEVRRLRAEEAGATGQEDPSAPAAVSVARSLLVDEFDPGLPEGERADDPPVAASLTSEMARDAGDSSTSITRDPRGVYCRSIARLALQVAEGLAYAHNEGILHRDIKPSNLLLDLKGTVWITDFGLAKIQDSAELTATGGLVGTIRYMAPERFKGKGDARCDVYGLGVTLYELLTLRPAFASNDRAEVLREVTESQPPRPRRIEPSVPKDLETIVLKAMAREPKDRYAGAAALAEDLRRFLSFEPITARRSSAVERLWRWCQREPAMATLTGISLLLLVALAAGSMVYAARLGTERNRTAERLVISKLQEGRAWRLSREPGSRQRSLDALREAATPATAREVRNEMIGSLALVELVETARRAQPAEAWAVDPEVQRAAVLEADGRIQVYPGVSSREAIAKLPPDPRRAKFLVFSPGGRHLAVCLENAAWVVWDVDGVERLFEHKARAEPPTATFDATGSRFAHVDQDGRIAVCDLPGGAVARKLEAISIAHAMAFDRAGRRLAAAGFLANPSVVVIHDLDSGAVLSRHYHAGFPWSVAWHPDGKRLAVACGDYSVYLWDVESGKLLHRLRGHTAEATRVYCGADGALFASSGWDNRTLIWSSETGRLLTEAAGLLQALSSEDRRLGFSWENGREGIGEWRLAGGEVCRALNAPVNGKGPRSIAISRDGRWLAAACYDLGLRVWSLDQPAASWRADAGNLRHLCFAPDGSGLWTAAFEGLHHWPLRSSGETNEWTLGPPVKVVGGVVRHVSLTADGRRAAVTADNGEITIRDLEAKGAVLGSLVHPAGSRAEISPSGRWLATSAFHGEDMRIWDAGTCKVERSIPVGTARVAFSGDERWLAISSGATVQLHETGTWAERLRRSRDGGGNLAGPMAFSRDGSYFVFACSRTAFGLIRLADGEEVARIVDPTGPSQLFDLTFSPDGGLLFCAVPQSVQVWDLRTLRRELSALGLDWDSTEGADLPRPPEHRTLRLDPGNQRPGRMDVDGIRAEICRAIDSHTQRILLHPDPDAFADRAESLERQGDWSAALADLDRALEGASGEPRIRVLRAAVLERLGRSEEALQDAGSAIALCCRPAASSTDEHRRACPLFHQALRVQARARSARGIGELQGAMASWKELLELKPEDREARESIPWLFVLGRCEDGTAAKAGAADSGLALTCAQKNHSGAPKNPQFLRDLGAVFYHLGRLEEAEPLLAEGWRLNPRMVSAAFHLAMIHHRRGQTETARSVFQTAASTAQSSQAPPGLARDSLVSIQAFAQRVLETPVSSGSR